MQVYQYQQHSGLNVRIHKDLKKNCGESSDFDMTSRSFVIDLVFVSNRAKVYIIAIQIVYRPDDQE